LPKLEFSQPNYHGHSHADNDSEKIINHLEFNKKRASKAKNIRLISNVFTNLVNDHKRDKIKRLVEK
jgi:hypothetical protein